MSQHEVYELTLIRSYVALDDGSLLASPFLADLSQALQSLVVLTIILLFFIRNVAVSGHYYFSRSKIIQDRRLFLALFVSQMVAPAGMLPTLASYFDPSRVIDCTLYVSADSFTTKLIFVQGASP